MQNIILLYLAIIFQGALNFGFAQTVINGKITDRLGQPVSDASVMLLKTTDSTVVAYNFSNDNGEFRIIYTGEESVLFLMVYGFNIRKHLQKIKNVTQTVSVDVIEEAIKLAEFSVKSEKIWGTRDTINYIVDAFRDSTDMVIGDVLKKMPGIIVKESGQIEYRGKPISKFYIENMDMLQGRYGIVTNNITAADIATVQVFENHQPIRALQDIAFSDDAALNLKLKPGAKGIYTVMADLGGGKDKQLLWNSGITGMYFGKTRQHLASLKTNNTGNDLEREFQSFYDENMQLSGTVSSIVIPSPPEINKTRYYFNQAFGGTVNNLIKTKDEGEFTFNLHGFHDIDDRKSYAQTRYIVPGEDTLTINEQMDSHSSLFKLEGGIGYKKNSDNNYLNTRLLFAGSFNESNGTIINNATIKQKDDNDPLNVANTIHWTRRGNNNYRFGTELYSQSTYQTQPYRLEVMPGFFANELNDSLPFRAVKQDVSLSSFETRNSLMFLSSSGWKSIRIHPVLLFSLEHQSLNSHLSKSQQGDAFTMLTGDSLQNDLVWRRAKAGVSVKLTYRKRDFNFELSTPLLYQYISLSDEIKTGNSQQNRFIFQPQANLLYNINTRWEVSGSWFYYNHNPNLRTLYSGYILQNYRTLSRYENKLSDSYGHLGKLKLSYKDIMQFLFTNLEISYNQYRNEVMYAQQFEGSVLKISLVEMENTGNYLSVTGRAGKGFDWKKLSVNAEASWGKGLTPQLRQDSLIKYKNQGINANMTLSLAITDNIQLANKCSWSRVTGNTGTGSKLEPIISYIDAASLNITLARSLILGMEIEYYETRDGSRNQNFYLLGAGMTYTWKRIRFSLDYNNILNTTNYVFAYYGSLNAYYSEYLIRPASILLSARFKLY